MSMQKFVADMKKNDRETVIPVSMGPAHGFTREELQNVFNCLCDHDDWKNPIRASIHPSMLQAALIAIEFFTATKATVAGVEENGRIMLTADGYRAGPAGDH